MGHFDESGHFVERGFNQSDAWLEEMDEANAQVIGGAKRRFVKPLQLDEEPQGRDEGEAPKPTTGQLAAWADELRKMLLDDKETVAALLKRLAEAKRQKRGKSQHVKSDPLFARPVARHKGQKKMVVLFCFLNLMPKMMMMMARMRLTRRPVLLTCSWGPDSNRCSRFARKYEKGKGIVLLLLISIFV